MPVSPPEKRRRRWIRWLSGALLAAVVYVAAAGWAVVRQGRRDETRPADAIVVFGAAEYAGRPSPVLRARLDHALALYQRRLAPVIITTGGYGGDPKFSEGGVGRKYLVDHGVPEHDVIAETQSESTIHSAERVAAIMRANGMRRCIAVSDDYHIFRIKKLLGGQGMEVYGAPRPQTRRLSAAERAGLILKEVVSYSLWRVGLTD